MALLFLLAGALVGFLIGDSAFAFAVLGAVIGAAFDVRNFLRARGKGGAEQELVKVRSRLNTVEKNLIALQETVSRLEARGAAPTPPNLADEGAVAPTVTFPVEADAGLEPAPDPLEVTGGVEPEQAEQAEPEVSLTGAPSADSTASPHTDSEAVSSTPSAPWSDEPPPSSPTLFDRVLTYFTEGNTAARVGTVLLTIGLGFLVQFAAREGWLPIELRLGAAGLVGMALAAVGWRLRLNRPVYALSLQGGGVGVAYLTVFAAMQLYGLVPNALGFLLLVVIAVAAALLAVVQDSLPLAFLGAVGGFLAPFFAAGEGGSHVVLFGYYLVLNAGILLVAWRKAWRPLNLLGYLGTFVAGGVWGGLNYAPRLFASTEPFLIAFFLLYLAVAVLYALRQPPQLRGLMDGTLVFTLPAVAFGLQLALVGRFEYGVALSALGFAAVYLLLALALFRRAPKELGTLAEAFTAIGIVFTALVLPFAFEASWFSAGWALGAAGLVWLGVRQRRVWLRLFGLGWHLLALGALGFIVLLGSFFGSGSLPFSLTLDAVASALALLFSAYTLQRGKEQLRRWERPLSPLYLAVGLLTWAFAGALELNRLPTGYSATGLLVFLTLSLATCALLSRRLSWSALETAALVLPPVAALFAVRLYAGDALDGLTLLVSALSWSVTFGVMVWLLRRSITSKGVLELLTALSLWVLAGVLVYHSAQLAERVAADWRVLVTLAPAVLLLGLLAERRVRQSRWVNPWVDRLLLYGFAPLMGLAWGVGLLLNALDAGGAAPPPYLPLLNPLDLTLGLVLLLLVRYLLQVRAELELSTLVRRGLTWALIAFGLLWTSGILARSVHHWFGVPYTFGALFASNVLQTALSIFWTLFALVAMLVARRLGSRTPWLVGAGLLALVVFKLFFVELANVSVLARIISFIGVGLLLLLIGYLAPLPPSGTGGDAVEEGAA